MSSPNEKSAAPRLPWRSLPIVALCALLAQSAAAQAPPKPPDPANTDRLVERLAAIGRATAPSFSPDGQRIALSSELNGVPQVWVIPAQGGWPEQVTAGVDPVGGLAWSPVNDSIALSVLPGGGLNAQIDIVRADGLGQRRLTDGGKENNRLGEWSADGRFLTLASNRRRADRMDAYLVDVASGRLTLLAELDNNGSVQSISRDARRVLLSRQRQRGDNDLYLLDVATRKETLLTPHQPPGTFFGRLAPDGSAAYLSSNAARDRSALVTIRFDAAGAPGPARVLAERPEADVEGVELNHAGTEATLTWNVAGRDELAYLDLATGKSEPGPPLPAELIGRVVYSPDDRTLAAHLLGSTTPPDVWSWKRAEGRPRRLTASPHPGVDLSLLVKPELVRYPAEDGLELSGWLYRPRGVRGPAPFVLSFHGGPEGQERPAFRADYQALLLRGIGVFAPNVRGSSGFGKRFVNLDNGPLRFAAIRDIKASADYLVRMKLAQPGRLGIMGGSYGGYMTMAGLTQFPDLFAAGANLYGIVNFATFMEHTEPWMAAVSRVEYGDPATQADLLKRLSPIHELDRIRAALMVQHGANDTNVPVVEAEQIVQAMRARGKPVEFLLFPDEGHGWRKTQNRVRSITSLVAFFDCQLMRATSSGCAARK